MSELKEVNPMDLTVDPMNERHEVVLPSTFEQSISDVGVVEPLIVRQRDDGEGYGVVVGQRRMMAAQDANVDTVPVIVREMGDADALEASIIENMDAFKQTVEVKDRAAALNNLMQMKGWTQTRLADEMNVSNPTMSDWLEYMKDEWRGTIIHAGTDRNDDLDVQTNNVAEDDVKQTPTDIISKIRKCMVNPEEGMKALQVVVREDLKVADVRTAKSRVDDDDESLYNAIRRVAAQKEDDEESETDTESENTHEDTDTGSDVDECEPSEIDEKSTDTEFEDTESDSVDTTSDDGDESGSDDDGDSDGTVTDSGPQEQNNEEKTQEDNEQKETQLDGVTTTMKFTGDIAEQLQSDATERECKPGEVVMDIVIEHYTGDQQ